MVKCITDLGHWTLLVSWLAFTIAHDSTTNLQTEILEKSYQQQRVQIDAGVYAYLYTHCM